jgi:choline dehydrogenase-like flavoprotein
MSPLPVSTLGTPRIGTRRELKLALETFWSGKSDETALLETAAALRAANWARQKVLGVTAIAHPVHIGFPHVHHAGESSPPLLGHGVAPRTRGAERKRASLAATERAFLRLTETKGLIGVPTVNSIRLAYSREWGDACAALGAPGKEAGLTFENVVLQPKSRGRLTLRDAKPTSAPLIDPNWLGDPEERVGQAHPADQITDLGAHLGPSQTA